MKLEEYIKKVLKKKGADDIVITSDSTESTQIKFVNNKIVKTGTEQIQDISIFVAMNKRIVVTSLKDCSKKGADQLINKIVSFIKKLPSNEEYQEIAKGPFKYKKIKDIYDKKIHDLNSYEIVERAINKASETTDRVSGVFETNLVYSYLTTSNNVESHEKGTDFYLSLRTFKKKGSGHQNHSGRMLSSINPEAAADHASNIANLSTNQVKGDKGKFKILFEPLAFAPILSNVGQSFSIFNVESGLSFFKDQLNNPVGSNNLTIYDDATFPNGLASSQSDREGVPSQKNTVINKGKLTSYLHNTSTAINHKTKTTANSGLVSPEPSNTIIAPGKNSNDKLLSSIDKGLYITNTWYTRFSNMTSGDFSTIPRDGAFVIKNGEIKQAVNSIRISENVINMLKNIEKIGNKQIQIRSWEAEHPTITPPLIIDNVNITKPST